MDSLVGLPEDLQVKEVPETGAMDFIQYFTKSEADLQRDFPLKSGLEKAGMLWICWL